MIIATQASIFDRKGIRKKFQDISAERIQTIRDVIRAMAQATEMKLMAMRVYKPDFRAKGTFKFQTTGIGSIQIMMSSTTLAVLLKTSNASMLIQCGL